jgi:organic radical activating enzyme
MLPIITQEDLRNKIPQNCLAINEIFYSIQGEGKFSGVPMVFIRFNLCSTKCKFCDTAYTWKNISHNKFLTNEQILQEIKKISVSCNRVCITGGEPFEQYDGLVSLCKFLNENRYRVQIETSGAVMIPENFKKLIETCGTYNYSNWLVCSPKHFNRINYHAPIDEVKILVNKNADIEKLRSFVSGFNRKDKKALYVSIQPIEPKPYNFGNFEGLEESERNEQISLVKQSRIIEKEDWDLNCKQAVEICLKTRWSLSLQIHKMLNVR